jgi:site-specific DNA-cytosine methylase
MDWIDSFPGIDVIWASPPCLEFSNAFDAPRARAARAGVDFEPDMSVVRACIDIIDYCKPSVWVLENVAGSTKSITPIIGKFQQHISSFFLWGNFPRMVVNFQHSKSDNDVWSSDPLRANKRAKIPLQLSQAFLQAIQEQRKLSDYL